MLDNHVSEWSLTLADSTLQRVRSAVPNQMGSVINNYYGPTAPPFNVSHTSFTGHLSNTDYGSTSGGIAAGSALLHWDPNEWVGITVQDSSKTVGVRVITFVSPTVYG